MIGAKSILWFIYQSVEVNFGEIEFLKKIGEKNF